VVFGNFVAFVVGFGCIFLGMNCNLIEIKI
jgi:hypothetical protein